MCIRDSLDTDHAREMAAKCLAHWHEYNMWPKEVAGDLVRWQMCIRDRG